MTQIVKSVHRSYTEEKYSKLVFSLSVIILMSYSTIKNRAAADEPDTRICIYFWQNLWKWSKVTGVIHARDSNLEEAAI